MARAPRRTAQPSTTEPKAPVIGHDVGTVRREIVRRAEDYRLLRDCREGEREIKRRGVAHLPMPSGFKAQPDQGVAMYDSYMTRAEFPEILDPTILGMSGLIHHTEAKIEGLEEAGLGHLHERATPDGQTLEVLHRAITEEILTTGRAVLLADAPAGGGDPFVALYRGDDLINWADDRSMFVLRETHKRRDGFTWREEYLYRVLEIDGDGKYSVTLRRESGEPVPLRPAGSSDGLPDPVLSGSEESRSAAASAAVYPTPRGSEDPMTAIPLVVAGPRDLSLEPDAPPLLQIARSSVSMYQLSADYRYQLFMTGQETLVFFGIEDSARPQFIGAGVVLSFENEAATAQYLSPSGTGIEKHKQAIDDKREEAAAAGARMFDAGTRGAEAAEALKIRARAQQASLVSVAITSAAALEAILRHCARFGGADPEQIVVKPSLDFLNSKMTPQEAKTLVEVWQEGAISYETLYENLQKGEIASPERTAEEEQELRADEESAALEEMAALDDGLGSPTADPADIGNDETGEVPEEELEELFAPEMLE